MRSAWIATVFVTSAGSIAAMAAGCGSGGVIPLDGADAAADATTGRDSGATTVDAGAPLDATPDVRDANTPDTALGPDDGGRLPEASVACGVGVTCTGAQVCCGSIAADGGASFSCHAGGCPDGGAVLECDGPEDCTPAGTHCCATLSVGAGSLPFCPISAGGARCRQNCVSQIPLACPATGTVRLCKKKADCANDAQGYTECCTFSSGAASATFCATTTIAQLGTCLP